MKEPSDRNVIYLKKAAIHSRFNAMHWMRYLRKFMTPGGINLTINEINILTNSKELTFFQKLCLKHAAINGSITQKFIINLNQKAKPKMLDELKRKLGK